MIRVIKDYKNVPSILLNATRVSRVQEAIAAKDGDIYKSNDYSPDSVDSALRFIYKNKCAYCESKIEHCASLQVEHYRPKAKVEEDKTHDGYYWLGCEWSNLLLACPACNGKGAKGNKFPLKPNGQRVYEGNPLDNLGNWLRINCLTHDLVLLLECPLLLNPELDEPKTHFRFTALGELIGKTDKGKATIEICDLNRDALVEQRQGILNQILKIISIGIIGFSSGVYNDEALLFTINRAFSDLAFAQKPENEYALWG